MPLIKRISDIIAVSQVREAAKYPKIDEQQEDSPGMSTSYFRPGLTEEVLCNHPCPSVRPLVCPSFDISETVH